MGHGLGFQTYTDEQSGAFYAGVPSIWDHYLLDNRLNQVWLDMTAQQRVDSATSGNGLSWSGPRVTAAAPQVLAPTSRLEIGGKAAGAAGQYAVGDASFGPPLGQPPVSAPGSSVSHYTTAAKPNQLMEPAINGDLTHALEPPRDLTLPPFLRFSFLPPPFCAPRRRAVA